MPAPHRGYQPVTRHPPLSLFMTYLYLAIAGRNIPVWVWVFLAALVVYGAWSTIRDTRRKIAAPPED